MFWCSQSFHKYEFYHLCFALCLKYSLCQSRTKDILSLTLSETQSLSNTLLRQSLFDTLSEDSL